MAVVSAYQRESVAQRPVMTAPMAYETAGLEAGLAAAVVLLAEARAQPRARRNERIFLVLV